MAWPLCPIMKWAHVALPICCRRHPIRTSSPVSLTQTVVRVKKWLLHEHLLQPMAGLVTRLYDRIINTQLVLFSLWEVTMKWLVSFLGGLWTNCTRCISNLSLCWSQLLDARCDQSYPLEQENWNVGGTTESRDVWCSPSELQNLISRNLFWKPPGSYTKIYRFKYIFLSNFILCGFRMLRSHVTSLQGENIVNFFWRLPLHTLRSRWTQYEHTNLFELY